MTAKITENRLIIDDTIYYINDIRVVNCQEEEYRNLIVDDSILIIVGIVFLYFNLYIISLLFICLGAYLIAKRKKEYGLYINGVLLPIYKSTNKDEILELIEKINKIKNHTH